MTLTFNDKIPCTYIHVSNRNYDLVFKKFSDLYSGIYNGET